MNSIPIIDPKLPTLYIEHPKSFLYELLDSFIAHIPETEAAIKQAFQQQQSQLLHKQLHKLKGACLYCGLLRLQKVIKSFQAELARAHFSVDQLAQLQHELQQVIHARKVFRIQ